MRKERLGAPVVIGDLTITPLERVEVNYQTAADGFYLYCAKEPIGILIEAGGQRWAVDIQGNSIPLDDLPVDNS